MKPSCPALFHFVVDLADIVAGVVFSDVKGVEGRERKKRARRVSDLGSQQGTSCRRVELSATRAQFNRQKSADNQRGNLSLSSTTTLATPSTQWNH